MRDVSQKFLFRNHIIFYANNTTQSIQLAEYPILPLFIPLLHCHVYVRPVGTTSDSIESTDKTLTQLNSNKPPYIAWKKEDKLLEKKIFCPHMEIYGIQLCRYLFVFSTILEHCARSSKFSLLIQYKMMIMKRNQYNKIGNSMKYEHFLFISNKWSFLFLVIANSCTNHFRNGREKN